MQLKEGPVTLVRSVTVNFGIHAYYLCKYGQQHYQVEAVCDGAIVWSTGTRSGDIHSLQGVVLPTNHELADKYPGAENDDDARSEQADALPVRCGTVEVRIVKHQACRQYIHDAVFAVVDAPDRPGPAARLPARRGLGAGAVGRGRATAAAAVALAAIVVAAAVAAARRGAGGAAPPGGYGTC